MQSDPKPLVRSDWYQALTLSLGPTKHFIPFFGHSDSLFLLIAQISDWQLNGRVL